MDDRPIFLLKQSLPHLLLQVCRRPAGAGIDHHAAHHLVKPMDCADSGRLIAQMLPQEAGHSPLLICGQHTVWLYADDDSIVLV
jgi:hypothetical protein